MILLGSHGHLFPWITTTVPSEATKSTIGNCTPKTSGMFLPLTKETWMLPWLLGYSRTLNTVWRCLPLPLKESIPSGKENHVKLLKVSYTELTKLYLYFHAFWEIIVFNGSLLWLSTAPSLPIKVSGEAFSRTVIILRFQKPSHAPLSNRVQVDYGKHSNELKKKKVCYGSSCVIGNLEEGTMYYFRVIGYVHQKGETSSFTQISTLRRGMFF